MRIRKRDSANSNAFLEVSDGITGLALLLSCGIRPLGDKECAYLVANT